MVARAKRLKKIEYLSECFDIRSTKKYKIVLGGNYLMKNIYV